jgi:hypothetical protein
MDVAFDCFLARKSMATCEELHEGYIIHIEQLIGLDWSQTKVSIAFVDWAFHFMEQVKVVHQLVINTTPSTLNKNRAISVSMGIDGTSGAMPTQVTSECNSHAPSW